MYIYLITCLINEKRYVGLTKFHPSRRWTQHVSTAKSGKRDQAICCAIRKHGKENFKWEILDTAENQKELEIKEWFFAEMLNTYCPVGYNLDKCGGKSSHCTHPLTIAKKSKAYSFISPDGEVVAVKNLFSFCRERGLDQCHMYHVAQGKRVAHKGWRTMKQKHESYTFKNLGSGAQKVCINAYGFKRALAKEMGIHESALSMLISGRCKSAGRWILDSISKVN